MNVSWKEGCNPELFVNEIKKARKINANGEVSFVGWNFYELNVLIFSILNFPKGISDYEGRGLVQEAIFKAGKRGIITTKSLLSEVNKITAEYINQDIKRYALVTSLSISQFTSLKRIRIKDSLLIIEKNLPKRFRRESLKILNHAKQSIFAELPNNYLPIRVHVSARSIHDAANKAIESIDFVRGIWNWFYNRSQTSRTSSGGKPLPVNKLICGPIHTLHFPSGELATSNTWWYEPSYLGSITPLIYHKTLIIYINFSTLLRML